MRMILPAALFMGCTSLPQLPTSTSTRAVPIGDVVLTADGRSIRLGSETVVILARGANGQPSVPTAALSASGIPALRDALRSQARGDLRVNLVLDRELPAAVALPILHTLLQSGVATPWIVVDGPGGQRAGIALTLPARGTQAADPDAKKAGAASVGGWANPTLVLDPDRGVVLEAFDRVYDGIVIPCPAKCSDGWPAADVNRLTRRLKLDHPRDRAIQVKPLPTVTVQAIVTALDASRDDSLTARGDRELFPTAVIDPRAGP